MESKESKISKVLSDITLKKVIIMVLLLMFLVPLFDTENYIEDPNDWDYITLRQIADKVGAILVADIAHPAGLIAHKLLRSPFP